MSAKAGMLHIRQPKNWKGKKINRSKIEILTRDKMTKYN